MIITTQKPFETILEMLRSFDRLYIVGCGTCATVCQTGGEEQVQDLAARLSAERDVVGTSVVETPCDARLVKRDLQRAVERVTPQALVSLTCGVGVQTLAESLDVECVPALDTKFLGKVERIGRFYERCRACGDCVLYETGGICPVARCAKSLLNGPCGGQAGGKCEVGGWQTDCAWVQIYRRLAARDQIPRFLTFRDARDHRLTAGPGELLLR